MPDGFLLSLVRHGQSEGNRLRLLQGSSDAHALSELGHKQAAALSKQLAKSLPTYPVAVYCSPLTRARQTCRHLLAAYDTNSSESVRLALYKSIGSESDSTEQARDQMPNSASNIVDTSLGQNETFAIVPLLSEKCFGEMEDRPIDQYLEALHASKSTTAEFVPAGGESGTQVQQRAAEFFQWLCQSHLSSENTNSTDEKAKTGVCISDDNIAVNAITNKSETTHDHNVNAATSTTNTAQNPILDSLTNGESSNDSLSHVLVVSHGCWIRGLLSHLVATYGYCGGLDKAIVGRITPNTGLSQFIISRDGSDDISNGVKNNNKGSISGSSDGISCQLLTVHDIKHLADLEAPQIPNL